MLDFGSGDADGSVKKGWGQTNLEKEQTMWKSVAMAVTAAAIGIGALSMASWAQDKPMGPEDCKDGQVWDEATKTCKPAG